MYVRKSDYIGSKPNDVQASVITTQDDQSPVQFMKTSQIGGYFTNLPFKRGLFVPGMVQAIKKGAHWQWL